MTWRSGRFLRFGGLVADGNPVLPDASEKQWFNTAAFSRLPAYTPRTNPWEYPGRSTVYDPITPLPMETLAELFVHPAGYCQNVLATGETWISGTDRVAGREAIVVECDHPRAVERTVDRPDYHVQVAVDRQEGIVTRLVESVGGGGNGRAILVNAEAR